VNGRGAEARGAESVALSLWVRLLKTHNLVLARLRPALARRATTLPQFDVMAQLARHPGGLTFRELSRHLLVSAGNLTGIVDRLEKGGLVRRAKVAHDRRSYRVALTAAGKRRIAGLIRRHQQDVERALAPIPAATRQALRDLLGEAAGILSEEHRSVRTAPGPAAKRGANRERRAS